MERVISSKACAALPSGWFREEIAGVSGLSTSGNRTTTVVYKAPSGHRVKSKNDLQKLLGDRVDLTNFDFFTGRFTAQRSVAKPAHQNTVPAHSNNHSQYRSTNMFDVSKAATLDSSVFPLKRRKEMLNDKKVTVVRLGSGVKHSGSENRPADCSKGALPRQVYGIKRLEGIRPTDLKAGRKTTAADFGRYVKPLAHATPSVGYESLVESVAAQILSGKPAIVGQKGDVFGLAVNADQPLAQVAHISDDDVAGQERKVAALRRRLTELVKLPPQSAAS